MTKLIKVMSIFVLVIVIVSTSTLADMSRGQDEDFGGKAVTVYNTNDESIKTFDSGGNLIQKAVNYISNHGGPGWGIGIITGSGYDPATVDVSNISLEKSWPKSPEVVGIDNTPALTIGTSELEANNVRVSQLNLFGESIEEQNIVRSGSTVTTNDTYGISLLYGSKENLWLCQPLCVKVKVPS